MKSQFISVRVIWAVLLGFGSAASAAEGANTRPTLSHVSDMVVPKDGLGTMALTVSDLETLAENLILTATSSDPQVVPVENVLFSGDGADRVVAIVAAPGRTGETTVTLRVTDEQGLSSTASFQVTVIAGSEPPLNTAPTLSHVSDMILPKNVIGNFSVTIGDSESAPEQLGLTATSSNPDVIPAENIYMAGSGSYRAMAVVPLKDQAGQTTITLTVTDEQGLFATTTFLVSVLAANSAPTLSPINDLRVAKNGGRTAAFSIGDLETSALALQVMARSSDTNLLPASNILIGGFGPNRIIGIFPAAERTGQAFITLTVTDQEGLSTFEMFLVTVEELSQPPANTPPTLSPLQNVTVAKNDSKSVALTVSDLETPTAALLVLAKSSNPDLVPDANLGLFDDVMMRGGILIAGNSGTERTVVLVPVPGQTGQTSITITVTDEQGLSNSETFVLTVTPAVQPPANTPPTLSHINDVTMPKNGVGIFSVTVSDLETPAANLLLSAYSSNDAVIPNANLLIGGGGAIRPLVIVPARDQVGQATITLAVMDGQGLATSGSFLVTVTSGVEEPSNTAPTVSILSPLARSGLGILSIPIVVNDSETEAPELAFSATSSNQELIAPQNILFGPRDLQCSDPAANRSIVVIPIAGQAGQATVRIALTDSAGLCARGTFGIRVDANGAMSVLPVLSVSRQGRQCVITWPTSDGPEFTLQTTANPADGSWTSVDTTPILDGSVYRVMLAAPTNCQFFRLRR